MPDCSKGFTTATINGASYDAMRSSSLKSAGLVLTVNRNAGSISPAIAAGTTVVFDTVVTNGPAKSFSVARSVTTDTLNGLAPTTSYLVSVAARNGAGAGSALASTTPVSPTVSISGRTTVLTAATLKVMSYEVRGVTPGQVSQLVWPTAAPGQLSGVQSGNTIVLGETAPDAHSSLMLVQSISHNHAGDLVMAVTPADMTDAYNTIGFSFSGTPPGAARGQLTSRASSPHAVIQLNWSSGGNSAAGTIGFYPGVSVSGSHWCTASNFLGLCYQWGLSATASASVTISENLTLTLAGSTSVNIFTCDDSNGCLSDIYFSIGIIPVEISPSLSVDLDLSGSVHATSNASVSWNGWITYSSSNGFSSGSGNSFSASAAQNQANGTAHAAVNLTFQMCAYYNVLCGSVTGTASLDAVFNSAVVSPANYLTLTCGLSLSAGFSVHIFGWNSSGSATLLSWSTQCYHVTAAAGVKVLTIANVSLSGYPLNTVPIGANIAHLTASRNDNVAPTLSWTLFGGVTGNACADAINGSGNLTTGCTGGNRSLTVRAIDTSVVPNLVAYRVITVQSGFLFDAPPAPTATFSPFGFPWRDATISMQPPVNTGGYPITFYYVTFSCPILSSYQIFGPQSLWRAYQGAVTTLPIKSLGVTYCTLTERAINSNGGWSPPTTTNVFL